MRPLCLLLLALLAALFGLTFPIPVDDSASSKDDFSCDCDHCNVSDVISLEQDGNMNDTEEEVNIWDKEDFDGDGNRTICARDRDEREDRTFSSICHMHCNNKCTRYRITTFIEKKVKKNIASVSRPNYYKLKDGPCQ